MSTRAYASIIVPAVVLIFCIVGGVAIISQKPDRPRCISPTEASSSIVANNPYRTQPCHRKHLVVPDTRTLAHITSILVMIAVKICRNNVCPMSKNPDEVSAKLLIDGHDSWIVIR